MAATAYSLSSQYPNVNGCSTDIEQSDPVRIFPNSNALNIHRHQPVYLPLLYSLYLFNWLLVRDFKDFFYKKRTIWKLITIPCIEYISPHANNSSAFPLPNEENEATENIFDETM